MYPVDLSPTPQRLRCRGSPFILSECFTLYTGEVVSDLDRHRTSISSSSGSSISEPGSPITRRRSTGATNVISADAEPDANVEAPDAPWNLVAYNIPWGPVYEGYETGTLPGPDGMCMFLRSPTPLKRQRTTQACDKCRARKAKCSGAHPACARCLSRGFLCIYGGASATAGARPTQCGISAQRRFSHPGSSGELIKPKPSERNRMRHQRSMPEPDFKLNMGNSGGGDHAGSLSLRKDHSLKIFSDCSISLPGLCDDVSGLLNNNDSPGRYPKLSSFDECSGTPVDLSVSSLHSSWVDSPTQIYPGLLRAPESNTATALYSHSFADLDNYRFPKEEAHDDIITQHPLLLASPQHQQQNVNLAGSMYKLTSSILPKADAWVAASGKLDALWRDPWLQRSGSCLALSPPESERASFFDPRCQPNTFDNNPVPSKSSESFQATISPNEFVQCRLADNTGTFV